MSRTRWAAVGIIAVVLFVLSLALGSPYLAMRHPSVAGMVLLVLNWWIRYWWVVGILVVLAFFLHYLHDRPAHENGKKKT